MTVVKACGHKFHARGVAAEKCMGGNPISEKLYEGCFKGDCVKDLSSEEEEEEEEND